MTTLLPIIRAVHFAACLLPLSVFTTMIFVVNPAAGRITGNTPVEVERFHRQLRSVMVACLVMAFASGFLWVWISIAGMSSLSLQESFDADLFKMVLTQTPPGHVWMLRGTAALLLAGISIPQSISRRAIFLCLLLAACLAGSLAWLGHAGAGEGASANIHLAADVLHLVSAAVWPGGLVPFALLLRLLLKSQEPGSLPLACIATRLFSSISLAAVGFLAVSGSINSYFLVGNFHALFSTGYGRLLLCKLGLFTAMIAIGAINLLHLKPRLSGDPCQGGADLAALEQIRRNVFIELCLGTLVFLAIGILGITPPAIHS